VCLCVCVCVYACVCVYVYVCLCVCVCVFMCMRVCAPVRDKCDCLYPVFFSCTHNTIMDITGVDMSQVGQSPPADAISFQEIGAFSPLYQWARSQKNIRTGKDHDGVDISISHNSMCMSSNLLYLYSYTWSASG